jgi:hypothetical protein
MFGELFVLGKVTEELDDALDALSSNDQFKLHRWDWFDNDELHSFYENLIGYKYAGRPHWLASIETLIEEMEEEMAERGLNKFSI